MAMMMYREQRKRINDAQAVLKPILQAEGIPTLVRQFVESAYGALDDAVVEISEARTLTVAEKKAAAAAYSTPKPF